MAAPNCREVRECRLIPEKEAPGRRQDAQLSARTGSPRVA